MGKLFNSCALIFFFRKKLDLQARVDIMGIRVNSGGVVDAICQVFESFFSLMPGNFVSKRVEKVLLVDTAARIISRSYIPLYGERECTTIFKI